ncbi:MAG: hypothetical protein IH845_04820 [Nanoarchaeota archaeon]|nr:hypothetical protein [Nanoarchaeota archaeon]
MNDRQLAEMKGIVNTPQFPGQQKGFSIDAIRTLIKKQKRVRGFRFNLVTSNQTFNINISGSARIFLGFVFSFEPDTPANFPAFFNLTINNEVVIQDVNPNFFTQRYMDDEYYFFPRPLSGQDDITLQTQPAVAAIILDVGIYYI